MTAMEAARTALKEVFGYDDFRTGQEDAVAAILRGREVMAVMPTGAGKSLCLSDSCAGSAGYYAGRFAAYFADARSGQCAAAIRRSRRIPEQHADPASVHACAG